MLPSQDSRFSTLLEERIRNMEEFGQVPLQFPSCSATMPEARRHLTFPAREKQKRNRFQRLCGLLGCNGAVATDGRLPQEQATREAGWTEGVSFRIDQVESVCWSAVDTNRATLRQTRHPRQAKWRGRRSRNTLHTNNENINSSWHNMSRFSFLKAFGVSSLLKLPSTVQMRLLSGCYAACSRKWCGSRQTSEAPVGQ